MEDTLYFKQIEVGEMGNFVYLIGSQTTREALVVDPAWDIDKILAIAAADEMTLSGALITHTHPDHVGGQLGPYHIPGIQDLLEAHPLQVYVHHSEQEFIGLPASELSPTDHHSSIELGGIKVDFIHTPGHTPGSQCFKVGSRLISGDTLFIGSCGRTDLPGSSPEALYESLTQKLMGLDDDTLVFPGHNYAQGMSHTSIKAEKDHNPYCRFPNKAAFLAAMGFSG